MAPATHPNCNEAQHEGNAGRTSENISLDLPDKQVLLACIFFLPQDTAPILALLQKANPNPAAPAGPALASTVRRAPAHEPPEDLWLEHSEAAEFLGVAKSTLYRYACEERIETRKLGGRLEYRRLTLDKFKDEQVRPARRAPRKGSIITPALGSGK